MNRVIAGLLIVLSAATARGDESPVPTAEKDLQTAQGRWRFDPQAGTHWYGARAGEEYLPLLKNMAAEGALLTIDQNRLTVSKSDSAEASSAPIQSAVIANDLPFLAARQEQIENSVRGQRLLLLTLPSGKGVLASWAVDQNSLSIRYPAGCCSRSGNILVFRRIGK